jgi:hypothetical protein
MRLSGAPGDVHVPPPAGRFFLDFFFFFFFFASTVLVRPLLASATASAPPAYRREIVLAKRSENPLAASPLTAHDLQLVHEPAVSGRLVLMSVPL